ncbi:MAG: MmgE/PrpD family protein [Burkholderiaceae bacterium]
MPHPHQQSGPGLTEGLATFAASCTHVPAKASDVAKTGIVNAIGLMLAARTDPAVVVTNQTIGHTEASPTGGASVLLSSAHLARPTDAAFVNGTAVHAFAMDDVIWGCHPSAVLLPAILAEAERIQASGADVLRAWVVGYEVLGEMVAREPDSLHSTGWHPTGLLGAIAAAAAVSNLLKTPAETARRAIAIAASFTGGASVNFGTQTKALHAGRAASAGVLAVQLAQAGLTATPRALEADNGFLKMISPEGNVDITSGFNPDTPPWHILKHGICIKQYPLCYTLHRLVDAAASLVDLHSIQPQQVKEIDVWLGTKQATLAHHTSPQDALQAKYSVEFSVASGLVSQTAGLAQLTPEYIRSEAMQSLMKVTRRHLMSEQSEEDPLFAPYDKIRLLMADGTVVESEEVRYPRGHAKNPLTEDMQRRQFMESVTGVIADPEALYHALSNMEDIADISRLRQLCNAA